MLYPSVRLPYLIVLLIVVAACDPPGPQQRDRSDSGRGIEAAARTTTAGDATHSEAIEVYFSESCGELPDGGPENLDRRMAALIRSATHRIDAALHELESAPIAEALIDAHRRGVRLRMVAETDYIDNPELQQLIRAGVDVVFDDRSGLMHNKFLVIDTQVVWTGSFNATRNGACRNDNNAVVLHSAEIAANFTAEFEEMFEHGAFGIRSPSQTPYSLSRVGDADVYTYFSPEDDVPPKLMRFLRAAKSSIHFMAFSFTDDAIGALLVERYRSGVAVAGVVERSGSKSRHSEAGRLRAAGIEVLADGNPGMLHHKVFVVDSLWTITGSYNFSKSAARSNDENVIVIKSRQVALKFLDEYRRVAAVARARAGA